MNDNAKLFAEVVGQRLASKREILSRPETLNNHILRARERSLKTDLEKVSRELAESEVKIKQLLNRNNEVTKND